MMRPGLLVEGLLFQRCLPSLPRPLPLSFPPVRHNSERKRGWIGMQLDIRDDLHIRHPRHTLGELTHDQAWKAKDLYTDWKRKQKLIKKVREQVVPEKFKRYDEEFDKVVTFEQQLQSLKTRGFLRPYKAYDPPPDLDQRFMRVCSEVLEGFGEKGQDDLSTMSLDRKDREKLLPALEREFGHSAPNSLLHTLSSVDRVFHFYSTRVDVRTPYEKLDDEAKKGNLPPNLHIQRRSRRFDPSGSHEFDRTTAFPGYSTIMVTPEARKKYPDFVPEERDPWINSYADIER